MKFDKMRSTASYFRHQFYGNGKALLFISIFSIIFAFISGINGQPRYEYSDGKTYIVGYNATVGFSVFLLCILCYFVPVILFSFFKKRRNLDYIYSMPIGRFNLGVVHYVIGLIMVFVPFTASYLTNFFLLLSRQSDKLELSHCLPLYFWCLLLGWIMYSLFTFVFNEANTTADGCTFMILWTFVFALISALFEWFYDTYVFIPWMYLAGIASSYGDNISKFPNTLVEMFEDDIFYYALCVFIFVGVFSMVYFLATFGKRRTEKTEEVSDSPFGYASMIPIYAITLISLFESIGGLIFITISAVIGYTIFRRGFKYKVADYVVMALLLGLCAIAIIQG